MILYLKPFRDIDRFIGQTLGKFYSYIAPNLTSRKIKQDLDDRDNKEKVNCDNGLVSRTVANVCLTLGEDVLEIEEYGSFSIDFKGTLGINEKLVYNMPLKYSKAIIAHEVGHLDTNILGSLLHKLAFTSSLISAAITDIHSTHLTQRLWLAACMFSILTGSYKRSEEFRCDEMKLKVVSLQDACDTFDEVDKYKGGTKVVNSDVSYLASAAKNILHSLIELVLSHPCDWSRKENLRQAAKELNRGQIIIN